MSSKVARNIFTLVLSRVFAAVLVFIAYASLLRYLGTYASGQYQFVISYVMLFSVVIDFGISQLVIKKVSENITEAKKYLGHFFAVEFILAFVILAILSLIAYIARYDQVVLNAIYIAGLGMFLNALTIPHKSILSAHQDMHKIAVINFFDSVINVTVIFAAIVLHRGIVFLALVQVFNGLMHLLIYEILIHRYVQKPQLLKFLAALDFELVGKMFKAALPFGMLVGFSIVYNKLDVIVLAHIRGYAETGLYTAAYKFVDLLAFVPAVVSSSLYPFFSERLAAGENSAIKNALENYTRYMLALALPIAFGGAVLATKLIIVVGGSEFASADGALAILVFASAIMFVYAAVNSIMISQLTRYAVWITFANIFINLIGNILLIPLLGFKAAALMTVLSELCQAGFYFYYVQTKVVSFDFARYIFKPLIAAAIMAAVLWPLQRASLLLTLPLGIAVYAFAILFSGFFHKGDLAGIKSMLAR